MDKKPTHKQRAINKLEALGWMAADVEKWNAHSRKSSDLFGFIDVLAIRESQTLALQVTSDDHVADRKEKIMDKDHFHTLVECLRAGWMVEVWGVRNRSTRDLSFAVVRKFQLINDGRQVAVYRTSSVLAI